MASIGLLLHEESKEGVESTPQGDTSNQLCTYLNIGHRITTLYWQLVWSEKSFLFSHRYVCHESNGKILFWWNVTQTLSVQFFKRASQFSIPFQSLSQVVTQPFFYKQNSHSTLIAFRYGLLDGVQTKTLLDFGLGTLNST